MPSRFIQCFSPKKRRRSIQDRRHRRFHRHTSMRENIYLLLSKWYASHPPPFSIIIFSLFQHLEPVYWRQRSTWRIVHSNIFVGNPTILSPPGSFRHGITGGLPRHIKKRLLGLIAGEDVFVFNTTLCCVIYNTLQKKLSRTTLRSFSRSRNFVEISLDWRLFRSCVIYRFPVEIDTHATNLICAAFRKDSSP